MSSQGKPETVCQICSAPDALSVCEGCGKALCRKCRSMEIYGSQEQELVIRYFCLSCSKDPAVNPSMGCEKVFGLEDVTGMVNQDQPKPGCFKIKLKM